MGSFDGAYFSIWLFSLSNPSDCKPTLYIFLDEGGDFNFSKTGSRYFTLTCVNLMRPFKLHNAMDSYKYDLLEFRKEPRIDIEYFHCAEDNSHVKRKVFELIASEVPDQSVDCVIVEKPKTGTALQLSEKFFPKMLAYLLRFSLEKCPTGVGEVVVITDSIPVQKKKKAIEKGIKLLFAKMLPKDVPYRIMHHASKAHYGLQVADYMNWAVFRKWEHGDNAAYDLVASKIRSEFDIFRTGKRKYYNK